MSQNVIILNKVNVFKILATILISLSDLPQIPRLPAHYLNASNPNDPRKHVDKQPVKNTHCTTDHESIKQSINRHT